MLLVNIQGSLHCKQGSLQENIILQLPMVYETESTTFCQNITHLLL